MFITILILYLYTIVYFSGPPELFLLTPPPVIIILCLLNYKITSLIERLILNIDLEQTFD